MLSYAITKQTYLVGWDAEFAEIRLAIADLVNVGGDADESTHLIKAVKDILGNSHDARKGRVLRWGIRVWGGGGSSL